LHGGLSLGGTMSGNYTIWTIVGVLAVIALLIFIF
jgi:hypothetical protein